MGISSDDFNQSFIREIYLNNCPDSLSIEQNEYINKQMKNSVCKIECDNNKKGTGFLCYIPFPDKGNLLPVLFTNNHVLDYSQLISGKNIIISFHDNKNVFKIDMSKKRQFYSEEGNIDTTIIEIKKSDGIDFKHFLDIDEDIFEENNETFKDKTIYLLHYPFGKNVKYSLGTVKNIKCDGNTIEHLCCSQTGSSGGPLLRLINFKVFGIHKGGKQNKNYNLGTILNMPIKNFYQESLLKNGKKNDISFQGTIDLSNIHRTCPAKLSFNEKFQNNNLKKNFILNKKDEQKFYNISDLQKIIKIARENSLLGCYDKSFENYYLGLLIIKYRFREIHLTDKKLEEKWKNVEKMIKEELDEIIEIMKILEIFNKVYK